MYSNQQLIIGVIYLLRIFVHSSISKHPGHLKPFGSSGPFKQIAEWTNDFPDPIVFFNDYVSKSHPILFRQALKNDPHLSIWNTDEQLNTLFSNNNEIVHVETRKKESRKQDILSMTMKEFLERYQHEELYLVEEVPNLLRPYFILPTCLQCKPALETFQIAMLWFSSGNTSSVVHTDDYDNINCVLQGDKQFILVDPNIHKDVASEIIDNYSGSFSSIDVDRVDYVKYPSLDNHDIHYYQINLTQGDCLFIPALWIHQVRSTNRNIAVNYWLNHERVRKAIVNKNSCLLNNKLNLITLATIQWPKESSNLDYLKNFMLDLIDEDQTSFKEWTREFSKEFGFDFTSNVQTITLFAEFFTTIDINDNGFVTLNEIESLFNSNNITIAYEILQDILDIVEVKFGKNITLNETFYERNHHINESLSGDEETDEDDYTFEHEDL
jgi:ribosomal protein L16 Arg81 hydroxylase